MLSEQPALAQHGFATRAIHAGYEPASHQGALNPPIYWSSTYAFDSVEQGAARFAGTEPGNIYARLTNPTVQVLEERLAALEGGDAAVAFGSGMGAICTLLWTLLRPGDELLVDRTLYGCTHSLVHHLLPQFGIVTKTADFTMPETLGEQLSERTKLVLFETPANPNMRLADIAAVVEIVRRRTAALVAVDNTYCTPYLQRPLALGADVVIHSMTKYLGGHGDVLAGALVGSAEVMGRMRSVGIKEMTGACISPMDAFLVLRGLKTLGLRMDRHCRNAAAIAKQLQDSPHVAVVHYPGLAAHPQYGLAQRQMAQPGGMIAFELHGGLQAGVRFMDALQLFGCAVSLGDAESLAQHPASMTHSQLSALERHEHLISEGLIRLSIGLEDVDDLMMDVHRGLNAAVR
ncbi:MAG: aminotransferase class I/II-fold pyridoxal phosphate-dependent enzyme [Luteimonas sp.]